MQQPLTGWWGHARPFDFTTHYRPAEDIAHFQCSTPSILAMSALEVCRLCAIAHPYTPCLVACLLSMPLPVPPSQLSRVLA